MKQMTFDADYTNALCVASPRTRMPASGDIG